MILKIKKTERFTVLMNDMLRSDKLSWEARGMLSFILSFPPDWKLNVSHLVKSGGISADGRRKCGPDKVYRILNELKAAGYITGQPKRRAGSFQGYEFIVHEEPVENVDKSVDIRESPLLANPAKSGVETQDSPDAVLPDTAVPDTAKPEAYEELTYTKDSLPRKARKESDGVVKEIQTLFVAFGSKYYHNGREAKACSALKDRFLSDKKRFGRMILSLRGMRNVDKFFADQPFAPSTLDTFWNKIEVQLDREEPEKAPPPAGPSDAEILAAKKKEMDDAGWKYNDSLDSLVHEAYTDYLHDKAIREAKRL